MLLALLPKKPNMLLALLPKKQNIYNISPY
jgi:hypothetical protein